MNTMDPQIAEWGFFAVLTAKKYSFPRLAGQIIHCA